MRSSKAQSGARPWDGRCFVARVFPECPPRPCVSRLSRRRYMSSDFPTSLQFDGIAEFAAVARLGTFTSATDELGLTKSAVARAVSRLEARLGAKLLHRTTRRLTLTSYGEAWLEHCAAALDELERGENLLKLAQNNPAGQVRIDLPTVFGRLYVMPVAGGGDPMSRLAAQRQFHRPAGRFDR